MQLKTLFEKNKNIIINTDIDGFLSGMILQKYYGCKVVGFSNSWDCVWIDPEYEKSTANALVDAIYIDLFVVAPSVVCIEQHIIGYDEAHNRRIAALQTKSPVWAKFGANAWTLAFRSAASCVYRQRFRTWRFSAPFFAL